VPGHKIATDEGFGLGLSIVRQLSQLVVGSEITVQSRLHRGSVFKFSVPDSLYSASWSRLISEFDDKSK
jgi:signal transduction histidine kinase